LPTVSRGIILRDVLGWKYVAEDWEPSKGRRKNEEMQELESEIVSFTAAFFPITPRKSLRSTRLISLREQHALIQLFLFPSAK
jgi:hypothetical protein